MTDKKVVTRFAPSPTGALHVGGARTALFNWAFARKHGGEFILRIEDTDVARSTSRNTRGLISDMIWLGLDWDQGPQLPKDSASALDESNYDPYSAQTGNKSPYFQSQRNEIYQTYLQKLQSAGRVYEDEGALRFKMPDKNITVKDLILGAVTVDKNQPQMKDFIIYKSEKAGGGPTFHFANIIDDCLMGVTHVIRGQEHLNNTPKHLALAEALGLEPPQYAHIPLIFNPDGSKMSKRDKAKTARAAITQSADKEKTLETLINDILKNGHRNYSREQYIDFAEGKNDDETIARQFAQALNLSLPEIDVRDFRQAGYLPDVLINYLALLGWNPGNDIEDFGEKPLEFLKQNFSLERVQKASAKFDRQKLLHFNGEHIAHLDENEFEQKLSKYLSNNNNFSNLTADHEKFALFAKAYRQRARTLNEPAIQGAFFVKDINENDYNLTAKPVKKMLRDSETVIKTLQDLHKIFDEINDWCEKTIDDKIENYAAQNELNMGTVAQPIRVAVSGGPVSPPIGITLAILGKDKTRRRIDNFISLLKQRAEGNI